MSAWFFVSIQRYILHAMHTRLFYTRFVFEKPIFTCLNLLYVDLPAQHYFDKRSCQFLRATLLHVEVSWPLSLLTYIETDPCLGKNEKRE